MRRTIIFVAAWMATVGLAVAGDFRDTVKPTNIPAQQLDSALQRLAKERDFQVLYRTEVVGNARTLGVVGEVSVDQALTQLLRGTGLGYRFIDEKTVKVFSAEREEAVTSGLLDDSNDDNGRGSGRTQQDAAKQLRLAQSASAASDAKPAADEAARSAGTPEKIDEIIVSAQKRSERLQDVPIPVTAIAAQALVETNQLRLQDFYSKIPGFSLVLSGGNRGLPLVAMRGITTGGNLTPTVGFVVDDVPYGSSAATAYLPHIDPSDLQRIEVLRGPQGTLYGASSMGGLIKYVTADPSTDAFTGRVEVGAISVQSGEIGHNVRAALNIPVTDTLAVRISGYTGRDPGYVDNIGYIGSGAGVYEDVNRTDRDGGQISALWRPSDAFSLKLSALFQDTQVLGADTVNVTPGVGDLQQRQLPRTGGYDQKAQFYSATVNAHVGAVELTSVSGYSVKKNLSTLDFSPFSFFFTGFLAQQYGPVPGSVASLDGEETDKFSQEIRLVVPLGEKIDWLVGGFYTREDTDGGGAFNFVDLAGRYIDTFYDIVAPSRYEERALFSTLTFKFSDRFDVQAGGRLSEDERSFYTVFRGPFATLFLGGDPVISETTHGSGNVFTYLLTPRFRISPDVMAYARLASGYRAGGANVICPPPVPCEFEPDKTQNYELGIKGSVLGGAFSYDASLYYIDWKDVQLPLVYPGGSGYTDNAGHAKSQGVEVSVEARPWAGGTLAAWVAYNDAELTDNPPTGVFIARAGDRLPYSGEISANLSLDQQFPLSARMTGFAGATVIFVDDREGTFPGYYSAGPRQTFPAYWRSDLRAGVKYDTWSVNVFVNNLADKRGILSGGAERFDATMFSYIQPRTFGLSLAKTF